MLEKEEEENRKMLDGAALNSQRNRASTVAPGDRKNTALNTEVRAAGRVHGQKIQIMFHVVKF